MGEIQLPSEEIREEILRRGTEAQAFIHSPLFVALSQWVDQEQKGLANIIALDKRDKSQDRLNRQEFVEQMCGYYRGIKTFLSLFQGFIDKANELQKLINEENKKKQESQKTDITMEQLRKKAYPGEK